MRAEVSPAEPKAVVRYIDVGCGVGFVTARVAELLRSDGQEVDVRGIDVAATAASRAAESFGRQASFEVGSLLDGGLPSRLGTFDVVTCFETLYYFTDDEIRTVAERLGSLVRPGGLLALSYHLPDRMGYGNYIRSLADLRLLLPGFDPLWEMDFIDSVSVVYDGSRFGRYLFSLLRRSGDGG